MELCKNQIQHYENEQQLSCETIIVGIFRNFSRGCSFWQLNSSPVEDVPIEVKHRQVYLSK